MPKRKPKDPERSPDMPHNWIERHLTRLEAFAYTEPLDLTEWQYRRAILIGPGEYEQIDPDWGTIRLGERWGGPDVTAFFRKTLTIPASHAPLAQTSTTLPEQRVVPSRQAGVRSGVTPSSPPGGPSSARSAG